MEDKKTFVEETDYKALWKYSYDKCEELKETNSALTDKVEDLEKKVADLTRELEDERERLAGCRTYYDKQVTQFTAMLDAFKYCIRYGGVGGDEL